MLNQKLLARATALPELLPEEGAVERAKASWMDYDSLAAKAKEELGRAKALKPWVEPLTKCASPVAQYPVQAHLPFLSRE